MMRIVPVGLAAALAGVAAACAPHAAVAPRPAVHQDAPRVPTPAGGVVGARATVLEDAAAVLGRAALAEVMRAGSAVLVRRSPSLPRMVQRPDGSWTADPPSVVAALRTLDGWVRIGAGGTRSRLDAAASGELDRLLGSEAFWSQEPITETACTDASGDVLLARRGAREFASAYPCGLTGLSASVAEVVRGGRITDWSAVPPALRPQGLPLSRFDEITQQHFRYQSGIAEQRLLAIRSDAEWAGQWNRITRLLGNRSPPPPVDFTREMLLMAAMGSQPSGGYRVTIERIIDTGDELLAFVRFISPGNRCAAIAAITRPVDIVRLPATKNPVRWAVEREATDCP